MQLEQCRCVSRNGICWVLVWDLQHRSANPHLFWSDVSESVAADIGFLGGLVWGHGESYRLIMRLCGQRMGIYKLRPLTYYMA